jgi:hypothetical protein
MIFRKKYGQELLHIICQIYFGQIITGWRVPRKILQDRLKIGGQ